MEFWLATWCILLTFFIINQACEVSYGEKLIALWIKFNSIYLYLFLVTDQTFTQNQNHPNISAESTVAVQSSIKPETNQPSKKMTARMSCCLWTNVLLVSNTSPRGWETDRSRPACDDSSKLRCIAFTGVMKSGHQRGKRRNQSAALTTRTYPHAHFNWS